MQNSNIEWTTHTFNPWEGCTKVSPGCLHCYAENRNQRFSGGANWGKGAPRRRTSASNWNQPVKWNREAELAIEDAMHDFGTDKYEVPARPRVFCASLADWLDDEVDIDWLVDLLVLVHSCAGLDWLMLTKRPENWKPRLAHAMNHLSGTRPATDENFAIVSWLQNWLNGVTAPANVWIGTTVEDQVRALQRIPVLLAIPAVVRFLSVEPLLEAVKLKLPDHDFSGDGTPVIHWVICGGESGPGARPFYAEWAHDLRYQCKEAGVAFFMKQFGANVRTENANALDWPEHVEFEDDGGDSGAAAAKVVLRDSRKGGEITEFPDELAVREFPKP